MTNRIKFGTTEISVVVGEPGLMPGQGGTVDALRTFMVGNRPSDNYAHGWHAVGIEVPGVKVIKTLTGRAHPLEPFKPGTATVTCWTGAKPSEGEPGWETVMARFSGTTNPAASGFYPTPDPIDAQSLTIVAITEIPGTDPVVKIQWPIWSGYVIGHGATVLADGRNAYRIEAAEYINWLQGRADPRYIAVADRVFAKDQQAGVRIAELLDAVGYIQSRPGIIPNELGRGYAPRALNDPSAWDTFLPRRTHQGLRNLTKAMPRLDINDSQVGLFDYIHKVGLAAEATVAMHQGVGPIDGTDRAFDSHGNNPTWPDRRVIPDAYGYPGSTAQIDWGGVIAGLKWGTDPATGFYTTGGFPTPIEIGGDETYDDWQTWHKDLRPTQDSLRSVGACVWAREGGVANTYIMDTNGRLETRDWHRKYGLREHHATGLPFESDGPTSDLAEVARKFLGTWCSPRPVFAFRQAMGYSPLGWSHVIAAALQPCHLFNLSYRRDPRAAMSDITESMIVLQKSHTIDASSGEWVTDYVVCTDRTRVGSGFALPRWPQSKTFIRHAGEVPTPVPDPPGAGINAPNPLQPAEYPRHGPRIAVPARGRPLVYWTHPLEGGDLPILAYKVGCRIAGGSTVQPTRSLTVDLLDNLAETASPWECYKYFRNAADTVAGAFPNTGKGIEAAVTVVARGLSSLLLPDEVSRTVSIPAADPPGTVYDVAGFRRPGDANMVAMAWRPPDDTGSDQVRFYMIYKNYDFDNPVTGQLNPGFCRADINFGPAAGTLHVRAFNSGGAGPAVAVSIPPHAVPAAVTTDHPAKPSTDDFAVYRRTHAQGETRGVVLWGPIAAGTAGPVTRLEIGLRRGSATGRSNATYTTGYQHTVSTYWPGPSPKISDSVDIRIRAGDATDWGPWSDYKTLPAGTAPGPVRELDAVRTSNIVKASQGYVQVWDDPETISNMPLLRADEGVVFEAPLPTGNERSFPDDGRYAFCLLSPQSARQGIGQNVYERQTLVSAATDLSVVAAAHDKRSPALVRRIPAQGSCYPPRDLIAVRGTQPATTGTAGDRISDIRWACNLPLLAPEGQPYQYRARVVGQPDWEDPITIVDPGPGTVPVRPTLPLLTDPQGGEYANDTTIEVQARWENGPWSQSATAVAPGVVAGLSQSLVGNSYAPPSNIRAAYMDLAGIANLTPDTTTSGEIGTNLPDMNNAYSLVLMWDKGPRVPNRGNAGSYTVSVLLGGSTFYTIYQTGSTRTWLLIPGDYRLHSSGFQNNPTLPGRAGPWLRVVVGSYGARSAQILGTDFRMGHHAGVPDPNWRPATWQAEAWIRSPRIAQQAA